MNNLVEVSIAPANGADDTPPIWITIKQRRETLARVSLTAQDFALAITGRLVIGELIPRTVPKAAPGTT